ncbi:MAG TPA: D-amino-acid transaminase [Rhodospirillaceae bacterium]|nr:D-amino-acid transaminase [Rhodospirillaceae bacterium]
MSRIAYVNGRFLPFGQALVHIEDRGYQFADGVYEVMALAGGRILDEVRHLDRLDRSLAELAIAWPMSRRALALVMRRLIECNRLRNGLLYLQVTRGVARRDHAFPPHIRPSLTMTVRNARTSSAALAETGVRIITLPDIRWRRCDIKSIALLPNVLGKQAARLAGVHEAWMVDGDGLITEGTSTNAWMVTGDGKLVTRQADTSILNGVTRMTVLDLARSLGLEVAERPFGVAEAKAAAEIFLTSTTSYVLPVVAIDGHSIGDGRPGPLTLRLRRAYIERMGL